MDAELLAAFVLSVPRSRLLTVDSVTPDQAGRLRALVGQRAARVPLQHLTGTAPFRHLELRVGPGVFVPRPETELLVEWGLPGSRSGPGAVAVDLCAGSGAIAAAAGERGARRPRSGPSSGTRPRSPGCAATWRTCR